MKKSVFEPQMLCLLNKYEKEKRKTFFHFFLQSCLITPRKKNWDDMHINYPLKWNTYCFLALTKLTVQQSNFVTTSKVTPPELDSCMAYKLEVWMLFILNDLNALINTVLCWLPGAFVSCFQAVIIIEKQVIQD